jgi:hypothetical protein
LQPRSRWDSCTSCSKTPELSDFHHPTGRLCILPNERAMPLVDPETRVVGKHTSYSQPPQCSVCSQWHTHATIPEIPLPTNCPCHGTSTQTACVGCTGLRWIDKRQHTKAHMYINASPHTFIQPMYNNNRATAHGIQQLT